MIALLLTSGCATFKTGPIQTEAQVVELDCAESVRVDILLGAGELELAGGANGLMDAEFVYNVAEWQPEVDYQITGSEGILEVRQPEVVDVNWIEDYRYRWDIQLNEDVPMALNVRLGAGEATLSVADLSLTSLDVEAGAGKGTIDLAGSWVSDLNVSIEAGVGEIVVILPRDTGARVEVDGGLGDINADGFRIDDGAYINDAYGESEATVAVEVTGGIGQVTLELAE